MTDLHAENGTDWLASWDAGTPVWSVEMGGLGPGYEQAIQVTAVELLRFMIAERIDAAKWSDAEVWAADRKRIETFAFDDASIEALGLSGAQFGAALSLAAILHKRGPRDAFADEAVKDRMILVSKSSPAFAA